jgi:hypothetical protein
MIEITALNPGCTYKNDTVKLSVYGSGEAITLAANPTEEPSVQNISWPGEYDFANTAVAGIHAVTEDVVLYVIRANSVACCFLPDPVIDLTNDVLEQLGNVNVLVLPATSGKLVQKLVDEIDPQIVLVLGGTNSEFNAETRKTLGIEGTESVESFTIKNLPMDGRTVAFLQA